MVELPTGKMKSREGTVVDADDLVDGMIQIAKEKTESLGKVDDFSKEQLEKLYDTIGLGALKFFLLRVDPKKKMIFNPEESIDFHGFTGPFIQYTHARIKSILRKTGTDVQEIGTDLLPLEKALAMELANFSAVVNEAAESLDPSKLAIYAFNLAKLFNSFYAELSIANAESEAKKNLRIQLGMLTAATLKQSMQVLGIEVPEQM
jgi:arginyl-tRNA synthetase